MVASLSIKIRLDQIELECKIVYYNENNDGNKNVLETDGIYRFFFIFNLTLPLCFVCEASSYSGKIHLQVKVLLTITMAGEGSYYILLPVL